ncbi:MAG: helix-turn-helix domain-containing protein [Eubacterium sp.]|nr:helix-turn-helix domain-containing protein [Eubacterium sp.]
MGNRKLNLNDRLAIERMLSENMPVSQIAACLGFHRATIYNEIKRCKGVYSAKEAQMNLFKQTS